MLNVTVELLGIARRATGLKEVTLELPEPASYHDLVHALAESYPALVGQVIHPQTRTLLPSFILNLGGRKVVKDLSQNLSGGERLVLMFVESGG